MRRWSVGALTEMPPEGKVGVSAVCILGVNINRGARPDGLQRPYWWTSPCLGIRMDASVPVWRGSQQKASACPGTDAPPVQGRRSACA